MSYVCDRHDTHGLYLCEIIGTNPEALTLLKDKGLKFTIVNPTNIVCKVEYEVAMELRALSRHFRLCKLDTRS